MASSPESRPLSPTSDNQQTQTREAGNGRPNIPHNSNFALVPFFVLFIGIASTLRAWPYLQTSELVLQCIVVSILALPVLAVTFFPRYFFNHRAIWVTTSRLGIVLLPSSRILISKLVNADSALGQKWAQTNPFGSLGILIFASRSLVFFASSLGTHMDFLPTVFVQILLAVSSYHTEPELCNAKLASSPMVLSSFNTVQSFLSSAWTIVLPFPHISPPPAHVVDPGTSLTAITFMIKVVSLLTPIIQSAIRAAHDFYSQAGQHDEEESDHAYRRYRNLTTASTIATASATAIEDDEDSEDEENDEENDDDDEDVAYDPIQNDLVPISRRRRFGHYPNIHRQSRGPYSLYSRTFSGRTSTSTRRNQYIGDQYTNNNSNINITYDNIYGVGVGSSTKAPPLEVRIAMAFGELQNHPIHAVWLAVAATCVLWACSYNLARHVCAGQASSFPFSVASVELKN